MPAEPPVVSPTSLAEAYAIAAPGTHRPLAGGTDLLVQITGEIGPPPDRVLDLWRLDELRGIALRAGALELGALTTYTDIRRSALCAEHAPALVEAAATIGAAQIQNRGTIGGNVMNASPAGDTLPVLLALDAELVVGGAGGERSIPAAAFWPAYRRDRGPAGRAPGPDPDPARARPVPAVPQGRDASRPGDLEGRHGAVLAWRTRPPGLARRPAGDRLGGGDADPGGPDRGRPRGPPPVADAADRAVAALVAELEPIDDVRSTAGYRRAVAGRVLRRLLREAGW